MSSMTQQQESTLALRSAVNNGVVDTVLHPFSSPLISNLLGYARKHRGSHTQNPNSFEPFQHPRSTSMQVHSLPAKAPAETTNFNVMEVARFVVPEGSVGFIEYIEQVVNDLQGSYYPTNQEYWGSPTFALGEVSRIRWWLKLDYFNGVLPIRFEYSNPTVFGSEVAPGMPYDGMSEIDALWYPAHNNKRLKLIIPGARMLRFYYYSPPTVQYEWEVRGRLTGYTQSTYSGESMRNARLLL